ncbi:alpha/beta fold hydrolase [Frigidibacter sp. MR17.24]|uniref:alpha/beta fold hydrolase n=1 Tax=Frigidibacter sp. MR17.24 TaxID=3127345 RepID=UPI0030131C4F
MHWYDDGERLLRYSIRHGAGPWLVLIHEMGGSIESWDGVLAHLPPGAGVVVPEMRGMGRSERIARPPELAELAADVAGLLDHLAIPGPVVVAGCAVGGAVALRFALDFPDRCAGVAPLGPAMEVAEPARAAVLALADRMQREGMRAVEPALLDRTYPQVYRDRNPGLFARVRGLWRANDPLSFASYFRMLAATDLGPEIAAISCPCIFAAGRLDALRPPAYVRAAAGRVPGATFRELDAGHHIADHAPAEVTGLLTELLATVAGSTPAREIRA